MIVHVKCSNVERVFFLAVVLFFGEEKDPKGRLIVRLLDHHWKFKIKLLAAVVVVDAQAVVPDRFLDMGRD